MRKSQASSARAQSDLANATVADIFSAYRTPGAPLVSAGVDPAILACFKMLDKKDSITRARALHEFSMKHLEGKSAEEVKATFPHFLENFSKGALLDPDWKCRLQYYTALRKMCEILGRDTEKHLKEFVPLTLISMFESSYKDVATASKRVLESLFPDKAKRDKVAAHFTASTVELIEGYLNSTPDDLNRQFKASETPDDESFDKGERYERVIVASLGCLEYLLSLSDEGQVGKIISLRPWRFLTVSSPAISTQIIISATHLSSFILNRWPDSIQAGDLELIGAHLSASLSPDMKEGWRLLSRISRKVRIDRKNITKLLSSIDVRNLTVEMINAIQEMGGDAKSLISKLNSGVEIDPRLRSRYYDILKALCSAILVIDPSSLDNLLTICRFDDVLRLHVLETASNVTFEVPIKLNVQIAGIGIAALLSERNIIETINDIELALVESGDIREIGFYAKYSKSEKFSLSSKISKIIENCQDKQNGEFYQALASLIEKSSSPDVIDCVRKSFSFSQFIRLVKEGGSWVSTLSASPLTLSLHDLINSGSDREALIEAIEFDKDVEVARHGEIDNGILLIGSPPYHALLENVLSNHELAEFADQLVGIASSKRASSGVEGYINDEVACKWFRTHMSNDNPVVSLFQSSESLRKRCIQIYKSECLDRDDISVDPSLLESLFIEKQDIESVITPTPKNGSTNLLALADYPFLNMVLLSEKFIQFVLSMAPQYPEDERLLHVVARWRELNTVEILPLLSAIIESEETFGLYWVVKDLVHEREKNVDDDISPLIRKCVEIGSDWSWFILSQLATCFHIPLSLSNELVDSLASKIDQLSNFQKAVLVNLDAAYLITERPISPSTVSRAEEEVFAIVFLAYSATQATNPIDVYKATFVDIAEVASLVLLSDDPNECESACRRFVDRSDTNPDKIDDRIIQLLQEKGSIDWALFCLDSEKLLDSGLKRLSLLEVTEFFANESVFSRMQAGDSLLAEVARFKLWIIVLEKFVSIKDSTFCFLFEFVDEALNRPDLTAQVTASFWAIGLRAFEIVQQAERFAGEEDWALYLYKHALKLMSLLLQSTSPGDIHEWASANQNVVAERSIVEHGISSELIQKAVSDNKFKRENLRSNFSLSSKLLVNNYSSHDGEIQAELSVRFPECWPLRLGTVEVSPVVGLSKGKNARLKISIQRVFRMNGVQNAIQIWIENIEGFLKDVEECYICYSVTYHHGTKGTGTGTGAGGSIPNKQCKTCQNKFHSECLLKYFRTSGKTICCLCQNPF